LRAESEIRPEDLPTSSWSSWCLSWVSASGVYLPEKTQQQALSEENLDFFYEAMGISKKDSGATQTEDFELKYKFFFSIEDILIHIKGLNMKKETLNVCSVQLQDLVVDGRKFSNSTSIDVTLGDLQVTDGWTEDCYYPQIVSRSDRAPIRGDDIEPNNLVVVHYVEDEKTQVLNATVESVDIVVNARWLRRLGKCFKKLNEIDSKKHVGDSIWKQLAAMRDYGLIQLRHAMEGSKELRLDVNINSPRLILPEEASSATSAALRIEAGSIRVINKEHEELKARVKTEYSWKEHLYQEYRLLIKHFQMIIVTSADGILRNQKSRNLPFWEDCDGEFAVEVLSGSDGYGMLPKIRVSALLPTTRIFLSGLILRDFVRVSLAMVEDEIPPNFDPLVDPMDCDEPCAEDVLIPQESIYPDDYDALNTRVFELHLAFQTASATLLRDTINEDEEMQVIGRLVTEGLVFQYQYRNMDMFVYFAAHSAVIEDHFQDTGDRYHFMASDIPEGAQVGHFDLDPESILSDNKDLSGSTLISFYFEKKAPKAPDFRAVEQELYISFKQLYVNLNRETADAIYEFINVGVMSDGKHKKHRQLLRLRRNGIKVNMTAAEIKEVAKIDPAYELLLDYKDQYLSSESDEKDALSKRKPPAKTVFFYISLGFQRGSVVLNDHGKNYAVIGVCKTDINVYQKDDFMDIRCSFPSLIVEGLQEKYHRRICNVNSYDRPLLVVYRKYLRKYANFPGYENKILIRASSVELTLLQSFLFRLTYFTREMGRFYRKMKETSVLQPPEPPEERSPERKAEGQLRYELEFDYTFLRIPRNSISEEFVQLELYDGMVKNETFVMHTEDPLVMGERCTLNLSSASGAVGNVFTNEIYPSLAETSVFFEYERAITNIDNGKLPFIPFRIYANLPSLHVKATESHYGTIVSTLMQGIDEYFLRCDYPPVDEDYKYNREKKDSDGQEEYIENNYEEYGENKEDLDQEENVWASLSKEDATLAISFSIDTIYAEILKEYDSDEDSIDLDEHEEEEDESDELDEESYRNSDLNLLSDLEDYENEKGEEGDDVVVAKEVKSAVGSDDTISPIDSGSSLDLSEDDNDTVYLSQVLGVLNKFDFLWISTKDKGVRMKISIDEAEMIDSRAPSRNKFVQLWSHPELDNEPHIIYEYFSDNNGHMQMNVDVKKLELIFIPLTYRALAFFFTNPYVSITLPLELSASIVGEVKETLNNPPLHLQATREDKTPNTDLLFYSNLQPGMSVAVSFSDASVIFPTKWQDENSRGAVVHGALYLQSRSFRDIFGIGLILEDADLKVCYLRDRFEHDEYLIENLNVNYVNTNVADLVELTLNIDEINVRTTYRDLVSVMGIINCVTPPDIQRDKHMKGTAHNDTESAAGVYHSMDIRSGGISITVIDEDFGNMPVFCLRGYVFTVDRDQSINGDSSVAIKVQLDGYNSELANWEPIIESWENITSVNIMPIIGSNPPKSLTKIQIMSNEVCNVNLSQYFYQLVQSCWSKWTKPGYLLSDCQTDYSVQNDLIIRNYSGVKVTATSSSDSSTSLDIGESLYLEGQPETSLAIQLHGGWKEIRDLPTDSLGQWVVALHPVATNCSPCLHWNIEQTGTHERTITISSDVFIKNHCSESIIVSLQAAHRGSIEFELDPDEENALPIQLAKSCKIFIRPTEEEDIEWSIRPIDCHTLSESSGIFQCPNRKGLPYYFCFHIAKSVANGKNVINILAPIVIENQLTHEMRLRVFTHKNNELANVVKIPAGEKNQLFRHSKCEEIDIAFSFGEYSECERTHLIRTRAEDKFPTFWLNDLEGRTLLISSKKEVDKHGREIVMIYASYWLVNKTGLPLFYKRKMLRGHGRGSLAPGQPTEEHIESQDPIDTLNAYTSDQSDWYESEEKEKGIGVEPLMFSYAALDIFKPRTSVKVADSEWSKAVGLESIGTSGEITADDKTTSVQYRIGVSIELLSERYFRTKVITFRPRYIIVNRTNREIYYTQVGSNFAHLLKHKQSLPFHWLNRDETQKLSITLSPHHTWSGGFAIDEIGEFAIKIRSKSCLDVTESENTAELNYGSTYLARVEIQLHAATFFVILKKQADRVPPYQLENYTDMEIHYYQKIHGAEPQTLSPHTSVPYTWDNASGVHKLVIDIPKIHYQKIMKMDKIKSNKSEEITVTFDGKEITYVGQVIAKGPTRILRIFKQEDAENNQELKLKERESDLDPTVTFQLFLKFKGIGISLIDSKPQEILYGLFSGLQMEYANSERHQSYEMTLDDFQIDNQLSNATFPVLLSQAKHKDEHAQYLENKCLHLSVILSNFYQSISYFHYVSFLLQELNLRVDDAVVNTFLDFFGWEIGAIHESNFRSKNEDLMIEPGETFRKIYIALLHINPLKCNVTLSYTESEEEDQQSNKRNHVKNYLSTVRATVSNIENAPISLQSLLLENIFNTRPELVGRISKHYYQQILWDIHKIIGSFDLIGNPVNLVTNLGSGVHDFFYEPIHGFVSSPADFLDGIHKGSSSLAKNSVSGIFNTISELTGTLGRGVAHLTFDKEYMRQRHKDSSDVPKNPAEGFGKGMKEFGKGIYKGITGIVRTPYEETKDQGAVGLVKGTGKGLIGAVVKPTVGFVDIAIRTTQGVKNAASFQDIFARSRPPRAFGPDKSIQIYDVNKAIGQVILRGVHEGLYENDWYISHFFTRSPFGILIISNHNILYVDCTRSPYVQWESSLFAIEDVSELDYSVVVRYHKISTELGIISDRQKRESIVQFDFEDAQTSRLLYDQLSAIVQLIHRFELSQTDIVFSNRFIL